MSRVQDRNIATWLGLNVTPFTEAVCLLDYSGSDSDAITLLPLLVERGYRTDLYDTQDYGNGKYWAFGIEGVGIERILAKEQTIAQAISAAVVKLIESI